MPVFDVPNFLDRAKAGAGVDTDYKLAVKVLGYQRQSIITNWRTGRNLPDDAAIVKLCELTGDDPAIVTATIHADRASDDAVAALWRTIAARLSQVPAAKIAVLLAIFFVAQFFGGTDALADPMPLAAGTMLQSSCLLALCLAVAFCTGPLGRRLVAHVFYALSPRPVRAC